MLALGYDVIWTEKGAVDDRIVPFLFESQAEKSARFHGRRLVPWIHLQQDQTVTVVVIRMQKRPSDQIDLVPSADSE